MKVVFDMFLRSLTSEKHFRVFFELRGKPRSKGNLSDSLKFVASSMFTCQSQFMKPRYLVQLKADFLEPLVIPLAVTAFPQSSLITVRWVERCGEENSNISKLETNKRRLGTNGNPYNMVMGSLQASSPFRRCRKSGRAIGTREEPLARPNRRAYSQARYWVPCMNFKKLLRKKMSTIQM